MKNIFISYRRHDSQDFSRQLYDQLVDHFGAEAIFFDVDTIPFGVDFRAYLSEKVQQCGVMLVIVGPHWLDATDEFGVRRLDQATDYVRFEVETGLQNALLVVPVLVNTPMPQPQELPPSLRDFAYRNAVIMHTDERINHDIHVLVAQLRTTLGAVQTQDLLIEPGFAGEHLPAPLRALGFRGRLLSGAEVIVPPSQLIPGGAFRYGNPNEFRPSVQFAERAEQLPTFAMATYPLTNAEFACFMRVTQHQFTHTFDRASITATTLTHPTQAVTLDEAQAYAQWLAQLTGETWDLPTEEEWEKAARGTDGRIYPWGNDWSDQLIPAGNAPFTVGLYAGVTTSPYGVEDLVGNCTQWTQSPYATFGSGAAVFTVRGVQHEFFTRQSAAAFERDGAWRDSRQGVRLVRRDGT